MPDPLKYTRETEIPIPVPDPRLPGPGAGYPAAGPGAGYPAAAPGAGCQLPGRPFFGIFSGSGLPEPGPAKNKHNPPPRFARRRG